MKYSDQHKEEVFKLFSEGFTVPEVEDRVPVNRRTLYRWMSEYLVDKTKKPSEVKEENIKSEIREIKNLVEHEIEDIEDKEISNNDWLNLALKKSISGCLRNSLIANKLSDRLLVELEKQDVNLRAIATFSNAINLHSRLEQSYGNYQLLLNPNLAISVLEAQGFIIDRPDTIEVA
jgi:transposase-like protein